MNQLLVDAPIAPRQEVVAPSAQILLQTLVDHGVRVAFGIPGGTASPLFDALRGVRGLRYVATRHEAGAGFAALGHARATGLPALVLTTSGPGVTNTLTAVASASSEEAPMIVVSGEVPVRAHGKGALQDGTTSGWRVLDVMRPLTRWCGSLTSPQAAQSTASQALRSALGARPGPVFVAVPLDVGSTVARTSELAIDPVPASATRVRITHREIGQLLVGAARPLLVLGAGARRAGRQAVALAERLGMPVAVTAHAKGAFPERHPLYLGVLGLGQHPSVDEYLTSPPDVSVVVASGLDDLATNGWSTPLLGTKASVQIDRDPLALGRSMQFTHLLLGDGAHTLEDIAASLPNDVAVPRRRVPPLATLQPELERSDAVPLKPPRVLRALQEAFPSAVWVSDIGEHLAQALHYIRVDSPDQFHNFLGFGSMGSGVGAAIGLQLAKPSARVVCVCGDGGFAMMLGELLTCVEQRLPIVFAVMNDGRWNMVEHGFRCVYGALPTGFAGAVADFAAIAEAFGAVGVPVVTPEDLAPDALRNIASAGRPVVLDIRIDADHSLTQATRAASIRHFCAEPS